MKKTMISLCVVTSYAACAQAATTQSFSSVQTDMFAQKGSVSQAWGDYDNDGDLDYLISIKGGEVRLYRNDNGMFVSVGAELGLPVSGDQIRGVSWGDYDNDGYLDIIGGSNEYPFASRSYVWHNHQGKGFKEVGVETGLANHGRISRQTNWVDVNNDGQLDVYAADRAGANALFYNQDGKFIPAGSESKVYDVRWTVGACWFDIDSDGDLDLFLANQNGQTDAVARNDQGIFTDIAKELGMEQSGRSRAEGGVGCAVGDFNNDGHLDLYVATYGLNLLYQNNGDGSFTEVGKTMGVQEPDHTVAAAWGDYDNDGLLDLIAVGYHKVDGVSEPYGKLYHNTGSGFAVDERFPELITAGDHGVEWVDYNNDGALDLSVTDGYGDTGGHFVFRNHLEDEATARMLSILVTDSNGHYTQAGAEVRFYNQTGEILGTRMVSTGGGYNAQSARPVYFAAPELAPVKVKVRFMGKAEPVEVTLSPDEFSHRPYVIQRPE